MQSQCGNGKKKLVPVFAAVNHVIEYVSETIVLHK